MAAWRLRLIAAALAVAAVALATPGSASAQVPPIPAVYSGTVTADVPVPDGLEITARVLDYQSQPVTTKGGRYEALTVAPPNLNAFGGQPVTFHIDGIQAGQTDTFQSGKVDLSFDLTFPSVPTPTPTPSPTPTITPTPTLTPIPTATPIVAEPAIYAGPITVAGGSVPEGAVLVVRIGDYESAPALIQGDRYQNLVVNPRDINLLGKRMLFFLNGVQSETTRAYSSGTFDDDLRLVFVGLPSPTPTGVPPTSTPTPPVEPTASPTSVLPTPVLAQPTITPTSRPTMTPIPPPPTPTFTPVVITATPPPTLVTVVETTPTGPSGRGCSRSDGQVGLLQGMGNLLVLVAPVVLIAGYRRVRR